MKEYVIFCQAPADIQYALSIYECNINNGYFYFYVVNVESIYRYLISLNLEKADITFIPYPNNFNVRKITSVIKTKNHTKSVFNKYFKNKNNCEIYYFSNNYDWLTFYCIVILSRRNRVYNYDHYSLGIRDIRNASLRLKEIYSLLVFAFITGIIFKYEIINNNKRLYFNSDKYGILKKEIYVSQNTYDKYSYRIENIRQGCNVLLFESDSSGLNIINNYKFILEHFIELLKHKGVNIYIKPHPRLGYSKFLENLNLTILPAYIPGEFIHCQDFVAIVGIETVAIAKMAEYCVIPVYSIIDLLNYNDTSTKEMYRKYLNEQSGGKIIFLKTMQDVDNLKI